MKLSIIIKTLNEAETIAQCIESALQVTMLVDGEVILADSGSSDGTIDIAMTYPINIVQLKVASDACCGVGPELGFQHARGRFIYLLDGDMVIQPDFVQKALAVIGQDSRIAGVGGYIQEMRASNFDFKRRSERLARLNRAEAVDTECLSGGGLYRREALVNVGYMSDRNLHALEEYDLGTRLRIAGWRLIALPDHAADHYSYSLGTWTLLGHRLRGGNFLAQGELLRAAFDGGYLVEALTEVRAIRFSLAVIAYWSSVLALIFLTDDAAAGLAVAASGIVIATVLLGIIRRDLFSAFYSVLLWHLTAAGLFAGLFRRRRSPRTSIDCRVLAQGEPGNGGHRRLA